MTKDEIQNLITALSNQSAANSITPAMLANILKEMNDKIGDSDPLTSTPVQLPSYSAYPVNWFMGHLYSKISSPTVEEEICVSDDDTDQNYGSLIDINDCDESKPLVRAVRDCWVEITGFITMRAMDSYTADRILRMYIINSDGERVNAQVNTVHFTGTTQIFSVPICYMARLWKNEILHLTHYSSSGTTSISANSWLNIKAYPMSPTSRV